MHGLCYSSMHNVCANAMQNVISLMNWEGVSSGLQCNVKYAYPKYYSSVHNVRSFLQCNAMQHVISKMNMGSSYFWCAMQCKAKSA